MSTLRQSSLLILLLAIAALLAACGKGDSSNTSTANPTGPASPASPASSTSPRPASGYTGAIDYHDCDLVKGWAFSVANNRENITVALYIDDKQIATAPAKTFRPDLKAQNIGTGEYGFSFKLPEQFKDKALHTVNVKVVGSNVTLDNIPNVSPFRCPL